MSKPQPEEGYFEANFASWLEGCLGVEKTSLDAKKEDLRLEAKNLFRSFSPETSRGRATALLESSLAQLLHTLGPSLTCNNLRSRICSLSVIFGALEGVQNSDMTISTTKLLTTFFLGQCAPIQDDGNDDFGDDYVEEIRDTAVKCLSATLKCRLQIEGGGSDPTELMIEACNLFCSSAKEGVERRCALPLEEEDQHARYLAGVTGGLSTLPRSRRSNCFDLIQSAVDGIQSVIVGQNRQGHKKKQQQQLAKIFPQVEKYITSFISFACNCLQGESDPRCLMQLLVLFHKIQLAFDPLFLAGKMTSFPIVDMFDAVAPYYPINFTPPPNDNHGITRAGLKGALMSVLSYYSYDKLAGPNDQDAMMSLSLGLVLERLIPMDGDQSNLAINAVEKKEAVDDMELILFPTTTTTATSNIDSVMDRLPKGSTQQISNALILTHQEAAIAVTMGGTDVEENKKLADTCRWLVSKIAYRLESVKDKSLWNDFVKAPAADMISKLESPGSGGRIAIAYLASLVASGGPQTTRYVLDVGLTKSIHLLKQYTTDEELATMAAYGIGAFFSSCRVAMDKAQEAGLHLHPHPVSSMSTSTLQILHKAFQDPATMDSYSLRNALVVALESVLVVSPPDDFDESDQAVVAEFVTQLSTDVLQATDGARDSIPDKSNLSLVMTSATALGCLMGKAMQSDNRETGPSSATKSKNSTIMSSKQIQDVLKSKIMVDLLFRSKQGSPSDARLRFDRIALSKACSTDLGSATIIIESLLHTLRDALAAHSVSQSRQCAVGLSHVLQNGGDLTCRAFHELVPPGVTPQDVIDKICDLDPRRERTKDSGQDKTISSLDLPATVEELQKVQNVRQEIVFRLLPAYKSWVPKQEIAKAAKQVAKILPPLSNQDVTRLSVMLPLLAESLENGNLPSKDEDPGTSLAAFDLATYALNGDYEDRSRSAAGTCLYAYVAHLTKEDAEKCPAKQLLEDVVLSSLAEATTDTTGLPQSLQVTVIDCLNLSSILGSAAASRGGISVSTADKVAAFLVEVACSGKTNIPFLHDNPCEFDFLSGDNTTTGAVITTRAAAAFGSMLCSKRPLWGQRLTHKALKMLEPTMKQELEGRQKPTATRLGLIAILCHLVCAGNLKSANLSKRGEIVKIIVLSIISGVFTDEDSSRSPHEYSEVKRLVVASILKVSCLFPGLLSSYTETLVIGLMRLYAGPGDSYPLSDVACKLLILQVLEKICHMHIPKKSLLVIKPAVTSILGAAMNHPSRLLREAAVTVRNTWFTLPE